VRISGACLRQEVPGVDDLLNFSFETRPGPRRIMKSLFELALEEGKNLSVRQSEDFSKMLVGAVSTTLIELSETKGSPARAMPRSEIRVLEAAKSFIANKLSDPTLNSAMVAEHCKVSERYLRRVFSSASWKVSSYIRETRLDKCRLALGNPALRHRPITDIAMSWGFVDPPHFSRAYKSRFDRSPREDRDLLLSRH
jgi:AraC-like DNA-binding protein